jgi:hypothetical protein
VLSPHLEGSANPLGSCKIARGHSALLPIASSSHPSPSVFMPLELEATKIDNKSMDLLSFLLAVTDGYHGLSGALFTFLSIVERERERDLSTR